MADYQTRDVSLEIKQVDDEGMFEGYASVFGVTDSYQDVCVKGCFEKTLRERAHKVKMLWQHDQHEPIGVWQAMYEDEHGLKVVGKLALSTQKGKECYELMKMGAIDAMSIGYTVMTEEYDRNANIRYLRELKLYEVSLVTFPANEEAMVRQVKNAFEDRLSQVEEMIEQLKSLLPVEPNDLSTADRSADDEGANIHSKANEADALASEPLDEETKHSLDQLFETLKI